MSDLQRLAIPFPPKMVAKKEGADYVNHGVVQQRLIGTIGPPDQRIVQFIRGDFDEKVTGRGDKRRTWPGRTNAIVGVVLACDYHIDGRVVHIEDVGEPEGYYMAAHDGERAKKAVSDAVKRCAKQVGVALNLWSKGAYFLPDMLRDDLAHVVDPERPNGQARAVNVETGEILEAETRAAEAHDPDAPDPDDVRVDQADDDTSAAASVEPEPAVSAALAQLRVSVKEAASSLPKAKRDDFRSWWVDEQGWPADKTAKGTFPQWGALSESQATVALDMVDELRASDGQSAGQATLA